MSHLFSSVFSATGSSLTLGQGVLALGTSLALGLALAAVYKYKTHYSKEFVMTLALLPSLVAVIIFLVSGNLGTSVAVAGTFSLIKFRSASGSSKELLAVFIATAMGLATGMGYLVLAICFSLVILGAILIFEQTSFIQVKGNRHHLLLTVPLGFDYEDYFPCLLGAACRTASLESIKYQKKKGNLVLEYLLEMDGSLPLPVLVEAVLKSGVEDLVVNKQAPKSKRL